MADHPAPVIWLLRAEVDFQEAYNRISKYSDERAEKFYHSVNHSLDQVALFPESGRSYKPKNGNRGTPKGRVYQ